MLYAMVEYTDEQIPEISHILHCYTATYPTELGGLYDLGGTYKMFFEIDQSEMKILCDYLNEDKIVRVAFTQHKNMLLAK